MSIPNHRAANLSELDMMIAVNVPPGGNWKDIPRSVPSQRLKQIREGFAAGKGSRSTYYGRLHPDRPSYTINTHFNRPGNGCHLHYDYDGGQHRVLSQREAARLQSFPDSFEFFGSQRAVNAQIGNAVPPLLAYQIAKAIPMLGIYVDLFCGAGGLSLGFKWAGWEPIVANDIDPNFLKTYRTNIHDSAILGSITDPETFNSIVTAAREGQRKHPETPLWIIGGPPCQGFSTAGNRRSMDDERNQLFYSFKAVVEELKPTGFVFENVPGLMNMDKGKVFDTVTNELLSTVENLAAWRVSAENYGIPQRRTRLIILGHNLGRSDIRQPEPTTYWGRQKSLLGEYRSAITVHDALSDLPELESGEDGSMKGYLSNASNPYQALMRSEISVEEYLDGLTR